MSTINLLEREQMKLFGRVQGYRKKKKFLSVPLHRISLHETTLPQYHLKYKSY
jgi:hypothetical protein